MLKNTAKQITVDNVKRYYNKMAVLFFLFYLFPLISSFRCAEHRNISLLDCSALGLTSVPNAKRATWVRSLSLRDNKLVNVNFTKIREQYINIKIVDLRENPLNCSGLETVISVRSDCPTIDTMMPTLRTTAHGLIVPASSTPLSTSSFMTPAPSSTIKGKKVISIVLITLGAVTTLIAIGVIARYAMLRKQRRTTDPNTIPLQRFDASSLSSSSGSETTLYDISNV